MLASFPSRLGDAPVRHDENPAIHIIDLTVFTLVAAFLKQNSIREGVREGEKEFWEATVRRGGRCGLRTGQKIGSTGDGRANRTHTPHNYLVASDCDNSSVLESGIRFYRGNVWICDGCRWRTFI